MWCQRVRPRSSRTATKKFASRGNHSGTHSIRNFLLYEILLIIIIITKIIPDHEALSCLTIVVGPEVEFLGEDRIVFDECRCIISLKCLISLMVQNISSAP